uniref:Uncharacterized protein n=1 Tax=Globisporangium ultimum (strain ATCC 200006 / CBS 805.95 / DAOM BR144) TaxID=431595 RepID=K3WHL3_GLOUD
MAGKIDLIRLQTQVEAAIEVLLRAADTRVSWNQSSHPQSLPTGASGASAATSNSSLPYAFLPGVYRSVPPNPQKHDVDVVSSRAPPVTHASTTELNDGELQLVLHGDNTFDYSWTMKRSGARAMEFSVEMQGEWKKPVLNRSRQGDEDQRVFLHTKRMRFQRLSNYGSTALIHGEHGTWKLCLKTLMRHGSEWAAVGETERGVPPIVLVLVCSSSNLISKDRGAGEAYLESMGAVVASQILSNSPACRVLAGLTKKIANKLGAPIDVMTDKWLPARHVQLALVPDERQRARTFNPFYWCVDCLVILWSVFVILTLG